MNVSDEEWLRKEGDGSKSIHLGAKKRLPEIFRGFLILPSWLRLMHLSHFSALPADTLRQHIVFFMRAKCQSCHSPRIAGCHADHAPSTIRGSNRSPEVLLARHTSTPPTEPD